MGLLSPEVLPSKLGHRGFFLGAKDSPRRLMRVAAKLRHLFGITV